MKLTKYELLNLLKQRVEALCQINNSIDGLRSVSLVEETLLGIKEICVEETEKNIAYLRDKGGIR